MSMLRVLGADQVEPYVADGASLGWHAHLEVRGDFNGPAHLSPGAVLTVHGAFEGERVGRDGVVVVLGRCRLAVAQQPGTAVGAGVVLVEESGQEWGVGDDGTLAERPAVRLPAQGSAATTPRTLRWSRRVHRFVETQLGQASG